MRATHKVGTGTRKHRVRVVNEIAKRERRPVHREHLGAVQAEAGNHCQPPEEAREGAVRPREGTEALEVLGQRGRAAVPARVRLRLADLQSRHERRARRGESRSGTSTGRSNGDATKAARCRPAEEELVEAVPRRSTLARHEQGVQLTVEDHGTFAEAAVLHLHSARPFTPAAQKTFGTAEKARRWLEKRPEAKAS